MTEQLLNMTLGGPTNWLNATGLVWAGYLDKLLKKILVGGGGVGGDSTDVINDLPIDTGKNHCMIVFHFLI